MAIPSTETAKSPKIESAVIRQNRRPHLPHLTYHFVRLALLLFFDFLAIQVAFYFLYLQHSPPGAIKPIGLIAGGIGLIVLAAYGSYNRGRRISVIEQVPKLFTGAAVLLMCLAWQSLFIQSFPLDIRDLAVVWTALFLLLPLFRVPSTVFERMMRSRKFGLERTIIVGAGMVGRVVAEKLLDSAEYGFDLIGFVDQNPLDVPDEQSIPIISLDEEHLAEVVQAHEIDHVIIAFSQASYDRSIRAIRQCEDLRTDFSVVPRLFDATSGKSTIDDVHGIPLVRLTKLNPKGSRLLVKRTIDLFLAILLTLANAPVVAILALIIRLDSPGPIFFKQVRIGKNRKPFIFYKFRTMYIDARERFPELYAYKYDQEELATLKFKIENDPRLTPFGKFLRRTSLDELPNLFNVLLGNMSIVGPRPDIPEMMPYYRDDQQDKLRVLPGVTGLAQVSGRGFLTFQETLDFDVTYARNQSLALDLKIILRTLVHVMRGIGAF